MILDLGRFLECERPFWREFETLLARFDDNARATMTLEEVLRFHYLYQRCSSDLARIATFSAEPRTREYLESLVARGYAEIHSREQYTTRFRPLRWLFATVPQTFRRHLREFQLVLAITIVGVAFGAGTIYFDPDSKPVLMPFEHLLESPAARVKREESAKTDRLQGAKTTFSAQLMTHNIQVALFTLALGMTWGAGSVSMLFYNGIMLGAVSADYIHAGYTRFLLGWLLPHGVVEIPAIFVAGQASFVLAGALIGWGDRRTRGERLRLVSSDLLTLAGTAALMLVWAGIIEAFLSQYHEPVIPYNLKIGFGLLELALLILFFSRAGRGQDKASRENAG